MMMMMMMMMVTVVVTRTKHFRTRKATAASAAAAEEAATKEGILECSSRHHSLVRSCISIPCKSYKPWRSAKARWLSKSSTKHTISGRIRIIATAFWVSDWSDAGPKPKTESQKTRGLSPRSAADCGVDAASAAAEAAQWGRRGRGLRWELCSCLHGCFGNVG